jgi:hypothetical protein
MPSPDDFMVGGIYRNRIGEYEVLHRDRDLLHVEYEDGTLAVLTASAQARIARNIEIDEDALAPASDVDANIAFFENVGFLAGSSILIEGFSPAQSVAGFADAYERLTGKQLRAAETFYSHGPSADKWGVELRVEFPTDYPHAYFGGPSPVASPKGESMVRINNNSLVRHLFALGFVFGKDQDAARIRARIPPRFHESFDRGFRAAEGAA